MNWKNRSAAIQASIVALKTERASIDAKLRQKQSELVALTKQMRKRPRRGTSARIRMLLSDGAWRTTTDIAREIPDVIRHRVQMLVQQLWIKGELERCRIAESGAPGRAAFRYRIKPIASTDCGVHP